jgi:hypothetical protein
MEVTPGLPIRKARRKSAFSVTFVMPAARLSRYCPPIDCRIGRFVPSGCRLISTKGRGSKLQVWTHRPGSWRRVASNERGVP